jgi:hypothetical protein
VTRPVVVVPGILGSRLEDEGHSQLPRSPEVLRRIAEILGG